MLLAVDTSTSWMGLASYDGNLVISESIWQTHKHHTVELAKAVDGLLRQSGIKPTDLSALAVAKGPGSFTSLRIGLAFVKGLALAQSMPVIGIPSLDIVAAAVPIGSYALLAVLQAGRDRLAVARYEVVEDTWMSVDQPIICDIQGVLNLIKGSIMVAGELNPAQRHLLSDGRKHILVAKPALCLRRPSYLAELAWKRHLNTDYDDPIALAPIYVHIDERLPE
ncbi:MAG: tRNA (adenosine(37)-N6)-threonylcarbamoyltransferase complex dimerization subunit type 1 TsaB [Anaerolineaceae bacterium]|nr:tRNA (adenosine(37)-N6)-threonylcarbamoyltransferase complex dimerization subunit type 1 TsaB [Anaerolineaceae bacterium]MBN2676968.1 tRNA (adenosine(37)-N6)-threonylcarbamoyltransferase complex dimerization subunit type 1 TsaB [Anaerolineaceae bacterium]